MNTTAPPLAYSPQQAIGKALILDPAELFDEENRAAVELGNVILHMQIYLQDNDRIVVLVADLGSLPAKLKSDFHQQMLIANSSWRDLAGGALCTNDSGDRAHLRLRLDLNTLDGESLAKWTEAFSVAAVGWARRVAAAEQPAETPAALPDRMSPPQDSFGFSPFNLA